MLLLTSRALAAGLPWECPGISEFQDASAYRDTSAGLEEAASVLYTELTTWVDPTCPWVESTTDSGDTTTLERTCAAADHTVTIREWSGSTWDAGLVSWSGWAIDVARTSGDWTRLSLSSVVSAAGHDHWETGPAGSVGAAWEGTIADLPADSSFTYSASQTESWPSIRMRSVETPGCAWSWSLQDDGDYVAETVQVGGRVAAMGSAWTPTCPDLPLLGTLDRVVVGAVDRSTWALDPRDTDLDGCLPGCDCDNDNAAINPLAYDTPGDGVDQDCDGADAGAHGGDTGTAVDTGPDPEPDTAPDTAEGEDSGPRGGPEPTPPIRSETTDEGDGCGAGAGWVVLLGLAGGSRRRRPHAER
jgi:hypothetical protein